MTPEGTAVQASALLDLSSSMSFVMEHLARQLQLPRKNGRMQVAGIGGALDDPSSHKVSYGVSAL